MQTLMLSNVLQSCSHAVEVVCYFEHEPSMVKEFQDSGACVRLLDLNRNSGTLALIRRLKKKIKHINPDVAHVQYMAPGTLPIIAARLAGVKSVFATVHQPHTRSHGWMAKLILRAASVLTTKFIAVSQNAEKSWFGTSSLFDETRDVRLQPHHFTIHNAIDTDRINKIVSEVNVTSLKIELAIPAAIPVIGAVSRLRQEKSIDILLEAFNLVIKSGQKAHLLLVGSGPDEKKLKDTAQSYELSSYITFYGEAKWEIAMQLMFLMDIVVVPSRFEGFGLTAAEAMAMGKPVVASETSGLKEVVINDETGLTFKVDDICELSDKIRLLLSKAEISVTYGRRGLRRIESLFSMDLFKSKIEKLYQ
jgi:L-malate glycosyltransferase